MRLKIIEKDTFVIYITYNINIINLKIMFPKFLGPICSKKKLSNSSIMNLRLLVNFVFYDWNISHKLGHIFENFY
jgi:hypothetical protein